MHTRPLALALLLATTPSLANDDCANAMVVTLGTTAFSTVGATPSSPAWPCAGGGGPDRWYEFTSATSDSVTISLCGSGYDTALQVFSGANCGALTTLACNDDSCGLESVISFQANAGQAYLFRIGGYAGDVGSGSMTISSSQPMGNDDCSGATPLSAGTTQFSTTGSTTSAPGWPCANGGRDIWFRYTAPASGTVEIELCGSGYDTALQVFSGDCGSLSSLRCNDDFCGLSSRVMFPAVMGTDYLVRVGGYSGNTGNGVIFLVDGSPMPLGTNYCMTHPNSSGMSAVMSAFGSDQVVVNDLELTCSQMPSNSFGYFLCSEIQGFTPTPGGSAGNLCVAGAIGRFDMAVQNSGAGSSISLVVDLTALPQPMGTASAMAGDSWNFQAWFRDSTMGAATSNFSDGLEIDFL